jgi:hypothetical protein
MIYGFSLTSRRFGKGGLIAAKIRPEGQSAPTIIIFPITPLNVNQAMPRRKFGRGFTICEII